MAEYGYEIPIWEKYNLTVEEAAKYFHIGENRIRSLISNNPQASYVLWNGNRALIKRKKFEVFIDSVDAI